MRFQVHSPVQKCKENEDKKMHFQQVFRCEFVNEFLHVTVDQFFFEFLKISWIHIIRNTMVLKRLAKIDFDKIKSDVEKYAPGIQNILDKTNIDEKIMEKLGPLGENIKRALDDVKKIDELVSKLQNVTESIKNMETEVSYILQRLQEAKNSIDTKINDARQTFGL